MKGRPILPHARVAQVDVRYDKIIPALREWAAREVVEDAWGAVGYHFIKILDGDTDYLLFPTR